MCYLFTSSADRSQTKVAVWVTMQKFPNSPAPPPPHVESRSSRPSSFTSPCLAWTEASRRRTWRKKGGGAVPARFGRASGGGFGVEWSGWNRGSSRKDRKPAGVLMLIHSASRALSERRKDCTGTYHVQFSRYPSRKLKLLQ